EKRVIVTSRRASRAVEFNRLSPGDVRITRYLVGGGLGRTPIRYNHDEAIHADHWHRPIVSEGQAVLAREPLCRSCASALGHLIAICPTIIAARPVMGRAFTEHHEDFAFGSSNRRHRGMDGRTCE